MCVPPMLDAPTLRAWRAYRGIQRAEAAQLLGIPIGTLETLERGRSPGSALWGPLGRVIELINAATAPPTPI